MRSADINNECLMKAQHHPHKHTNAGKYTKGKKICIQSKLQLSYLLWLHGLRSNTNHHLNEHRDLFHAITWCFVTAHYIHIQKKKTHKSQHSQDFLTTSSKSVTHTMQCIQYIHYGLLWDIGDGHLLTKMEVFHNSLRRIFMVESVT